MVGMKNKFRKICKLTKMHKNKQSLKYGSEFKF